MEPASLKYLRARTNVRLMQLISGSDVDKDGRVVLVPPDAQPYDFVVSGDKRTFQDLVTKAGLAEIKTYADGIGVWKPYLLPSQQLDRNGDGKPDDLNGDGVMDERDRVLLPPTYFISSPTPTRPVSSCTPGLSATSRAGSSRTSAAIPPRSTRPSMF